MQSHKYQQSKGRNCEKHNRSEFRYLAREGKRVLLLDCDPQGSMTISLGFSEPDDMEVTLSTLMMRVVNEEKLHIEDAILHHEEGVDLIPSNIELSALEISMVNVMSRETILRQLLEVVKDSYDYVILDCMPSLGMVTINALACADSVLIPVQAAYLPVKGLQQLRGIGGVTTNKQRRAEGPRCPACENEKTYQNISEIYQNYQKWSLSEVYFLMDT